MTIPNVSTQDILCCAVTIKSIGNLLMQKMRDEFAIVIMEHAHTMPCGAIKHGFFCRLLCVFRHAFLES